MVLKEECGLAYEDFILLPSILSRDVTAYELCVNKNHCLKKGSFSF